MSKIFLPNGGYILIHHGSTISHEDSGRTIIRSNDLNKTWLATIEVSGAVNISDSASYTYTPPKVGTLDDAFTLVAAQLKELSVWRLKDLKALLNDFDARSLGWKKK